MRDFVRLHARGIQRRLPPHAFSPAMALLLQSFPALPAPAAHRSALRYRSRSLHLRHKPPPPPRSPSTTVVASSRLSPPPLSRWKSRSTPPPPPWAPVAAGSGEDAAGSGGEVPAALGFS
ncbi:hypothetical protein BS78_09G214900 [Paspalum vaginatum]|nr:hypothetical protein BS78_09G214900 [Paspalum vaginatum]